MRVALESLETSLGLIVPHLNGSIVRPRQKVGLVAARVVVQAIDAALVTIGSTL